MNELIPTVCSIILINRLVSEVIPFPISRHSSTGGPWRYEIREALLHSKRNVKEF